MMAIAQLKIDTKIVRIVPSFILAGAALAFCFAFGFGTRDVLRQITARLLSAQDSGSSKALDKVAKQ